MRKILLLLMLLCSTWAVAQDVIVKTDGTTILCRIIEVNSSEVVYKKWSDLKGSNYVMNSKDVSAINYESGKKEDISKLDNKYSPYNQNTGYGQMNDNALALMDMASNNPQKKAKLYKRIGLFGGGGLIVVGGILTIASIHSYDPGYGRQWGSDPEKLIPGVICLGLGAVGGGICLIQSRKYQKQAELVQSYSLLQQDFHFNDGSSLTAGVDLLKDDVHKNKTVGIGLRYNF